MTSPRTLLTAWNIQAKKQHHQDEQLDHGGIQRQELLTFAIP